MSTNWTGVEDALRAWVLAASGLDNGHVIWETPNASRPAGTYIGLKMGTIVPLGIDEVTGADNPSGTPGVSDYTQTVTGRRQFTLMIQCYAPPVAGHLGPPAGTNSPQAILSRVQSALALPATMDALAAAGCSSYDTGSVTYIPALTGTVFEGRAHLEPGFYALETVTGNTTYIGAVTPIGATFNP